MNFSEEINHLYQCEDIYKPSQSLIDYVKNDENVNELMIKFEEDDIVRLDLNMLLHIHQYNANFRHKTQALLNRIVERYNEE